MSKGVESVSVTVFPAAAAMDELSEVQLAIVLAMAVLAISVILRLKAKESQGSHLYWAFLRSSVRLYFQGVETETSPDAVN